MTRTVSVLMIAMLTSSITMAQPGGQQGPPKAPSDKQIEKMVKSLDRKLEKNVKAVLDKDQKKDYTTWLKEQEKNRPSQGGPQGGQRPPR